MDLVQFKYIMRLLLHHVPSARLEQVVQRINTMASTIQSCTQDADKTTRMIKQLDREQGAIQLAIATIEDAQELKENLSLLSQCMTDKDYETASGIIYRYLYTGKSFSSPLMEQFVLPVGAAATTPKEYMETTRNELAVIVSREFSRAVLHQDQAEIRRYFKLFPLIGETDKGLEAYADFLCDMVAERCKKRTTNMKNTPTTFSDAFRDLFEMIALAIDHHYPLVETHYGPGKMAYIVKRLQTEGERQTRRVLDMFEEERQPQKLACVPVLGLAQMDNSNNRSDHTNGSKGTFVDFKGLDAYLNELAAMHQKFILYKSFTEARTHDDVDQPSDKKDDDSVIQRRLAQLMKEFTKMERLFTRKSIAKAMQLQTSPQHAPNAFVDDAFFILRKSCTRAVATCDATIATNLIKTLYQILEADVIRPLYQKATSTIMTLDVTKQETPPQLLAMNSLELASDYIAPLTKQVETSCQRLDKAYTPQQLDQVLSTCKDQSSKVHEKTKRLVKTSQEHVFDQTIKAKLRTQLTKSFKSANYNLNEEQYEELEIRSSFARSIILQVDELLSYLMDRTSTTAFKYFFDGVQKWIAEEWERTLLQSRLTILGSLRLDKDLRAVLSHLRNHYQEEVKAFKRLVQICTLLNMEQSSELDELLRDSSISLLSQSDVRKFIATRMDLS